MKPLDLRAMKCPAPVVETRRALLSEQADSLSVLVADETTCANVTRMANAIGYGVQTQPFEEGFQLDFSPETTHCGAFSAPAESAQTLLYVSSQRMGGEAKELGEKLMVSFICTLLELEQPPQKAIFVNEGVRLTTTGSPVLEALATLQSRGTEIASCGLCLDFFALKDSLEVGRVGTMLETVQAFADAERIIQP